MKRASIAAGLLIGLVVAIGIVVVGANLLREPDPETGFSLARPPAGQARADYLADGTPVWVIGHEDGTVDVLSGFDTHVPFNLGKLLWWCPTARGLEDVSHGNRWDESGANIGGPAPAGLASWEVTVQSSRVFLGEPRPAPTRDGPVIGPPEHERDWCLPAEDPVVFHTFDGWEVWDSPTAAVEAAPERLDPPRGRAGRRSRRRARSPLRARRMRRFGRRRERRDAAARHGPTGRSARGARFIAHVRDGALVDVTRVMFLGNAAP